MIVQKNRLNFKNQAKKALLWQKSIYFAVTSQNQTTQRSWLFSYLNLSLSPPPCLLQQIIEYQKDHLSGIKRIIYRA